MIYDKNPAGVAQVFFSSAEEADLAIASMNGRLFFNNRLMTVETWDGKTKYSVKETAEQEAERLQNWDKFLAEGGEESKEKAVASNTTTEETGPDSNESVAAFATEADRNVHPAEKTNDKTEREESRSMEEEDSSAKAD